MRIIGRIAKWLVGIVLVLAAILYGGSEWVLRRGHTVALKELAVPADAAAIAEGARLARLAGCRHCHGREGQGAVLVQDAMFGRIAAPALADAAARYSDAELARAVRHGLRKDGSTLWIMPSHSHRYLADDDMARIVAWIRTLKPGPKDSLAQTSFGPLGRGLVLFGMIPPAVQIGSVSEPVRSADTGRYFAGAICAGCHALDRELPAHDGKGMAPALAPAAAAYDLAGFQRLLHTGKGPTERDLGLMGEVSRESFTAFTPAEIKAIHDYLKAEADKLDSKLVGAPAAKK